MLECHNQPESPIEGIGEHWRNTTLRPHGAAALALLIVLIAAWPSHAAIAVVQTASCSAQGATNCTTTGITTTTGNLFVINSSYCCDTFTSVTDNKSNVYGNAIPAVIEGSGTDGAIRVDYKASGAGGASHTFTLTGASSAFFGSISVIEVSGATASPLDQTATHSYADGETSDPVTDSTGTTAQANELLVGVGGSSRIMTFTTTAPWTEQTNIATDANTEGIITGTQIVAAMGTYTYTHHASAVSRKVIGISTWKEGSATRQRCIGCSTDKKVIGE